MHPDRPLVRGWPYSALAERCPGCGSTLKCALDRRYVQLFCPNYHCPVYFQASLQRDVPNFETAALRRVTTYRRDFEWPGFPEPSPPGPSSATRPGGVICPSLKTGI